MPTKAPFYPPLAAYISGLLAEAGRIPDERKRRLDRLAGYVAERWARRQPVNLHFICTHNSRRSQISQVWAAAAARHVGLDALSSYSGGTEATAFHPGAAAALERAGFRVEDPGGVNPRLRVSFAPGVPAMECYSKTFDDPRNPQRDFAAIMTCSEADENCPFIPGAAWRLSLPYEDPKEADGTPEEAARYDECVREIGRELLYAMQGAAGNRK